MFCQLEEPWCPSVQEFGSWETWFIIITFYTGKAKRRGWLKVGKVRKTMMWEKKKRPKHLKILRKRHSWQKEQKVQRPWSRSKSVQLGHGAVKSWWGEGKGYCFYKNVLIPKARGERVAVDWRGTEQLLASLCSRHPLTLLLTAGCSANNVLVWQPVTKSPSFIAIVLTHLAPKKLLLKRSCQCNSVGRWDL